MRCPIGRGRVLTLCEGGLIEEIRPGDVVWFAPGFRRTMVEMTRELQGDV
jgi:uncharacterized cupin superfamily protein